MSPSVLGTGVASLRIEVFAVQPHTRLVETEEKPWGKYRTTDFVPVSSRSFGTRMSTRPKELAVTVRGFSVTWAWAAGAAIARPVRPARMETRVRDIGDS